MAGPGAVKIEGLREFRNELKKANADLPKEMRAGFRDLTKKVVDKAKSSFQGGEGVEPKAADAVGMSVQTAEAAIKLDGKKYPWALGAEFGGGKYGAGHLTALGGHTTQFRSWRGNGGDAGYHLYPEIRDAREHIVDDVDDLLKRLTSKAFPD